MRLYDTITQSDLNNTIDLLLNNYHREIRLNIDEPTNDFCGLSFDLSDGVDAGDEIIFNNGDSLHINVSDKRLALMGYSIRFYYYQLDKGDYQDIKSYGELQSFTVELDDNEVTVPFIDNQIYLQKEFDLVLLKDVGYRLLLNTTTPVIAPNEDAILIADYTWGSVPVEDIMVSFYDGETLIGTAVTDSDGLAILNVSNLNLGSHNINAVVDGVYSNNVSVTVNKIITNITLTSDETMFYTDETFTIYGTLSRGVGYEVLLYENDTLIDTLTTDENGAFSKNINHSISDNYNYKAVYNGDSIYESATSNTLSIFVVSKNVTIIDHYYYTKQKPDIIDYSHPFIYTGNVFVDWGDNSGLVKYTGGKLSHIYGARGHYNVKVYGDITGYDTTFYGCRNIYSVNIPVSVTSILWNCFIYCNNLSSIILNWDTKTSIVPYDIAWTSEVSSDFKFSIPQGTTSLYTAKGYPSDKLVERSE